MILRGRAVPLALAGALGLGGMLPIQPVLAGSGVVVPSFRCRTRTIGPSPGYNYVYGVDAVSSDDVWMVGNYTRSDFTVQPLTEHWDGRAWKIVQAEELTYGGVLYKVSVVSSTDVWAVGYQGTSNAFVFQ